MSATIRRDPAKQGLQLIRSRVNVASDGFVELSATFLAPATGVGAGDFLLDSEWPLPKLPSGVPQIQGGPFLLSRDIYKENGLTYIAAVYTSAVNENGVPRLIIEEASEKLSFSAYKEKEYVEQNSNGTFSSVLSTDLVSFDYWSVSQTFSFALVGAQKIAFRPKGQIVGSYLNFRRQRTGGKAVVEWRKTYITTASVEKVGLVRRYRVTSKPVYEAEEIGVRNPNSFATIDALSALTQ